MNMLKKSLALLLTLCMLISVVPLTVFAADTTDGTAAASETGTDFYRILHLDCGRKYFTKDWIIALINEMAAAGYTHLELAFGNDGLRFLLDDMSVGSYSDDAVTAAIQDGNKKYYDFGTNELTQTEMDAIISHANTKGISIIPLLNNPGHMNAIVSAASTLTGGSAGYTGSSSTVDLENSAAVAFTKGLLQKYITYFKNQGCTYFNMGADEYANDVYSSGSMGFGALTWAGKYQLYVNYVNDIAAIIKSAGMNPIAFNDGIYFNQDTGYNFDKDITVAFWTSGWNGYQSASASTMAALGHDMINVNGDYYYVLGKNDQWDSNSYTYASNWNNSTFMGSTVSNPVGGMFCIWCDYPNAETETQIAVNTRLVLRAMAAEMQGEDAASVSTDVVPGGFNTDGTLNEDEAVENVTVTHPGTTISVTAPGLTELTAEVLENPVITVENATDVVAWDITPVIDDAPYTGSAVVKLPIPDDWTNHNLIRGFYVENGEAVMVKGTPDGDFYSFRMPHFSEGGLVLLDSSSVYDHLIELTVGEDKTVQIDGVDLTTQTINPDPAGIATVTTETFTVEGNKTLVEVEDMSGIISGGKYLISAPYSAFLTANNGSYNGNNNLLALKKGVADVNNTNVWTITSTENGYTVSSGNNSYLTFDSNTASVESTAEDADISIQYYYYYGFIFIKDGIYLNNFGGEGKAAGGWEEYDNNAVWYLYRIDGSETAGGTNVTFTGDQKGETFVNINNEIYKIVVHGMVDITIKYQTADGTLIKTVTDKVADNATTYTLSHFNHGDKYYTVDNTTLEITPATVTEYTVTVTESEVKFDEVADLTIEYWQTSSRVNAGTDNSNEMNFNAIDAYSEEGITLLGKIPSTGTRGDVPVVYWRSRLLPSSYHQESEDSDTGKKDSTWNGTGFTKVRYWNNSWEVYTEATETAASEWKQVQTTDQLVAYYMCDLNLADEVKVGVADWATKGNVEPVGGAANGYNSIVFQVIYEGGTSFPANVTTDAEAIGNASFIVHHWTPQRGIGTISITQIKDFAVWKVTATTGTHELTSNNTIESISWLNNERVLFEDENNPVSQYTIHNPAQPQSTLTDPAHENLYWDATNESILIRIYIKAIETEDSLKAIYVDELFNTTLAEFNYSVESGTTFANIVDNNRNEVTVPDFVGVAGRVDVTNLGIINNQGDEGKFQKLETTLANVAITNNRYNIDLYSYNGSVISSDKKTITHYFTINTETLSPNFVADFGLPLKFPLSQVVGEGQDTAVESVTVNPTTKYGTLSYDNENEEFTYTPTQILPTYDVLTINIKFSGKEVSTTNVGVTPATTVYYDDSFIGTGTNWVSRGTSVTVADQTCEKIDHRTHNYGYDPAYKSVSGASHGTYLYANTVSAITSFEFTGTGIQIFANATTGTGYVAVAIKDTNNNNKIVKYYIVNTDIDDNTAKITGQNLYGLPIISLVDVTGLPHSKYQVELTKVIDGSPIMIDGFRVFGTISDTTIYNSDLEDEPVYYELRDYVLNAVDVEKVDNSQYGNISEIAKQIYAGISGDDEAPAAIITDKNIENLYGVGATAQDLLDNGPKNELYLYAGQTLTFNVSTKRTMQIGLKAPAGQTTVVATTKIGDSAATTVDLINNGDEADTISSTVDMFYTLVGAPTESDTTYNVSIKNTGDNVLSVTLLKICDDPNAAFVPLTVEDIENILTDEPTVETPVEPSVTYADASLTVYVRNMYGRTVGSATLTTNGIEGETHTFTAEEILEAVSSAMGKTYKTSRWSLISDVEVVYGESGKTSVQEYRQIIPVIKNWYNTWTQITNRASAW